MGKANSEGVDLLPWRHGPSPTHARQSSEGHCIVPGSQCLRMVAHFPFVGADEQQMAMYFSRTEPAASPGQLQKANLDEIEVLG